MTITILCAGALARPHAATPGSEPEADAPLPTALTDGTFARAMRRARMAAHRRQTTLVPDELPDEAWLRERFAVDGHIAACTLPPREPSEAELLVRPVHLQLALDHLVLAPLESLDIGYDEACALAAHADAMLAEEGLRLRVVTPDAWRLAASDVPSAAADLAALAALLARSARMAAGRNIDAYLPSGAAARRWRQLDNLVQMAWFEHPVNVAREAGGRLPVNGIWLEGRPGRPTRRPFAQVAADDAAIIGLAQRAGARAFPLEAYRGGGDAAPGIDVLLAPDLWRQSVSDGDALAWAHAWQSFDRWFAGLLQASPRAVEAGLRLVLTGERSAVELFRAPADRWKPWRSLRLARLMREAA